MKVHRRKTRQSGADRMLVDRAWHGSRSMSDVAPGDILRVRNVETFEEVDWEVTEDQVVLSAEEAEAEWRLLPFGTAGQARAHGFFPYVLRGLRLAEARLIGPPPPRYIPSEVRIAVWHRDQGRCKHCGATTELQFDHIIPVARGGASTEENVELRCGPCNRHKGARIE